MHNLKRAMTSPVVAMALMASVGAASAAELAPSGELGPTDKAVPDYNGPLASWGKTLHEHGIDIGIDFLNLYQNAPNFGFSGGSFVNYGTLIFSATGHITDELKINIAETVNTPRVNAYDYRFNLSNAFFPVPVVDSGTDLTRFTIEADLLDDRLEIEGGRLNLSRDFMKKDFCGGPGCINSTSSIAIDMPGDAQSEWGGRAGYKLSPTTTIGFGVLQDNPDNWQNGDGWAWGQGDSKGYIGVANFSYDDRMTGAAKPLRFEAGVYHQTSSYQDALYNSGWGNPTFGRGTTVVEHSGTTGVYAQSRKSVWRGSDGLQSVDLYGGVFHTFGDGQAYPWEAYGGMEYSGFWAANPVATVGATVHYIGLSEKRAEYERNARKFFSGIDQIQPRDTFMVDVHGRVGVTRNGMLEMGVGYVINPNTTELADYSRSRQKDGFVFFTALVFDLSGSLGLSAGHH